MLSLLQSLRLLQILVLVQTALLLLLQLFRRCPLVVLSNRARKLCRQMLLLLQMLLLI